MAKRKRRKNPLNILYFKIFSPDMPPALQTWYASAPDVKNHPAKTLAFIQKQAKRKGVNAVYTLATREEYVRYRGEQKFKHLEKPAFPRKENPSGVRIVHNKLLGGWFIVRGPHQVPIGGRFNSKAEAQAHLRKKSGVLKLGAGSVSKGGKKYLAYLNRQKNPSGLFTPAMLAELAREYANVNYVDPAQPAYQKLIRLLSTLSQPQLKQLSKARIKFVSPLAWNRIRDRKANPIKGPGKFEGETYAGRYAYENADEDLGDVQDFGWYGNFSGKIKGRGPFHIIVREDSQGFVYGEFFDTAEKMRKAWRRLEREYEKFTEESGEE